MIYEAMRRIIGICGILAATAGLSATARADQDSKQRRVKHGIDQAWLYMKMGLPDRALEQLKELAAAEPGTSDGLVWLALARLHYERRDLDPAVNAFERAEALNVAGRLSEAIWASEIHDQLSKNVGSIMVQAPNCKEVEVPFALAAPMVDKAKRELLENRPGSAKTFRIPIGTPFYLPTGKYEMGPTIVTVEARATQPLTADALGAQCVARPAIAQTPPATPPPAAQPADPTPVTMETQTTPEQTSFWEDNWLWLALGGAALVAIGTSAALAAGGGDPRFSIDVSGGWNPPGR